MTVALSRPVARDRRRWVFYGLLASLVLNAFLLGFAATEFFRIGKVTGPLRFELRWLEGRLPDADFARVQTAADGLRPQVQAHIDRMRTMRVELGTLVAAPRPDQAAIHQKPAAIRAAGRPAAVSGGFAARIGAVDPRARQGGDRVSFERLSGHEGGSRQKTRHRTSSQSARRNRRLSPLDPDCAHFR